MVGTLTYIIGAIMQLFFFFFYLLILRVWLALCCVIALSCCVRPL